MAKPRRISLFYSIAYLSVKVGTKKTHTRMATEGIFALSLDEVIEFAKSRIDEIFSPEWDNAFAILSEDRTQKYSSDNLYERTKRGKYVV